MDHDTFRCPYEVHAFPISRGRDLLALLQKLFEEYTNARRRGTTYSVCFYHRREMICDAYREGRLFGLRAVGIRTYSYRHLTTAENVKKLGNHAYKEELFRLLHPDSDPDPIHEEKEEGEKGEKGNEAYPVFATQDPTPYMLPCFCVTEDGPSTVDSAVDRARKSSVANPRARRRGLATELLRAVGVRRTSSAILPESEEFWKKYFARVVHVHARASAFYIP